MSAPSEGCRKWTLICILLHADVQVRDTVADVAEALGISSFPALIVLPAHGGPVMFEGARMPPYAHLLLWCRASTGIAALAARCLVLSPNRMPVQAT